MNRDVELIARFVRRALDGQDVSFDEIEGLIIAHKNEEERAIVENFWNELIMFVNDYDIRSRDEIYAALKGERLQESLAVLEARSLLPNT